MIRAFPMIAVIALTHATFCSSLIADPDNSFVRAAIGNDSSSVTVTGGTRVAIVAAVLRGLEKCHVPADGVTAGPCLRLPENTLNDSDKRPCLTVCVSSMIEGGTKTAYICITPKFAFTTVAAVAAELRTCGFTDVRLLSDDDFGTKILALSHHPVPTTSEMIAIDSSASK